MPVSTILRFTAALVAVLTGGVITPVEVPNIPPDIVVVSSMATADPRFTLTATKLGSGSATLAHPAPITGEVAVDKGIWDGVVWIVELDSGTTATMTGER